MDYHFRDLPEFQSSEARLMTASAASNLHMLQNMCWRQHSTSYKEISVPMTTSVARGGGGGNNAFSEFCRYIWKFVGTC